MRRTGRTALFADVRHAFRLARQENAKALDQRIGGSHPPPTHPLSRRSFLRTSAAAVLAAYSAQAVHAFPSRIQPRIAVVGAGIAGLNATFHLRQAGQNALLFEASDHIGGRIQTAYNKVGPNVYSELGGEFVDSDHDDMMALARAFGLGLIDTGASSEDGLGVAYYADGRLRTEDEVIAAFQPLAAQVDSDANNLSDEITYNSHSAFDAALDRTNLRDYLKKYETVDWLYKVLEAAYVNEYGLDLVDQSALNFVETIGTDTSDGFQVYGESDQRYKIRGGNHQIVQHLAQHVEHQLYLGMQLDAISRRSNGEYLLSFGSRGSGRRLVVADFVILCLPFTILRQVDIQIPLPAVKRRAINQLGYGANGKLILGFHSAPWRAQGFDGDSYVDQPYQSGWDSGREQYTTSGITTGAYTIYPGGQQALDLGAGSVLHQANRLMPGLEKVFPGVTQEWRGTALRAYWPTDPYVQASYAAYRPGQWTSIRGAEGETVGNLYFAGEHTSLDWQGYMNGGAESGRLAAEALIARLV